MRTFKSRLLASLTVAAVAATPMAFPKAADAYSSANVAITGHGFGHGRGLSQYGSLGYALSGSSWQDILGRYYSNTSMGDSGNPNIGVQLTGAAGKDFIGVSNSNYTAGGVSFNAGQAVMVRREANNSFKVYRSGSCAGAGGWGEVASNLSSVSITPSFAQNQVGDDLNRMLQWCGTDTRGYRGAFTVTTVNNTLQAVNNVFLEDYLRGVIPRESPASWGSLGNGAGMNQLRAQTVAARSYAISSPGSNWTTCDTTACQVYGGAFLNGARIEADNTNNAIAQTAEKVRILNGAVARTEFSSSSGGWTAGGTFPAVEDAGDSTSYNPNYDWNASVPVSTIETKYPAIGSLDTIVVTGRNGLGRDGGRVTTVRLTGSNGAVDITGAQFRTAAGLKSDWFSITNSPSGGVNGYWIASAQGGIYAFGGAPFYGSAGDVRLNQPIVGLAARNDKQGYWLVASDGGVFSYGGATFHGSTGNIRLNQPIVGASAKSDNSGYWLVASDGGVFSFGGSQFHGSTGNIKLNQPVVGMAPHPSGDGYWIVASDGGVFSFGASTFHGSTGNIKLNQPIVSMASTPSGNGYWLVAADGGVFAFGDAQYLGGLPARGIGGQTATGITATKTGNGYIIATTSGNAYSFGDAPQFGNAVNPSGGAIDIAPTFE